MLSRFFITRPKFAFVISIILTLIGGLSIWVLPVSEFPDVTPPTVQVVAQYPGASPQVLQDSVAATIEEEVNGVEGMAYMSSSSDANGTYKLSVTFEIGTDDDIAQVNVQNRVDLAEPTLPDEVKKRGVTVRKQSTDMLLVVNVFSPGGAFDGLFLSNYTAINIQNVIKRIDGVADATILGELEYGMRIWLDPARMANLGITAPDVVAALQEQNVQVAAGLIGAAPTPPGQQFQYNVTTPGRLERPEEFAKVVIKADVDGNVVYLGDIARIEMGAQSYAGAGSLDNAPSTVLAIYQLPDANALDVASQVKDSLEELGTRFPDDLEYAVMYDTTRYVEISIEEVVITLLQALALVIAVVFLFLQDWRATIIPSLAIPVSLIGTFAFLLAMDMSINTISLFALILAIGIVVDDAIVVVENVQRWLSKGLAPKEATEKAMAEVTGPVIATTVVLLSVFVPVALMPGLTGRIYSQFAVTICISVVISAINALTLSPALCASILQHREEATRGPLGWFNRGFHATTQGYARVVEKILGRSGLVMLVFVVLIGCTGYLLVKLPTAFVPTEDKGALMVDIRLPDGASVERTSNVLQDAVERVKDDRAIRGVLGVYGFSLLSGTVSSNAGMMIVVLKDWDDRTDPELQLGAVVQRIQGQLQSIPEANLQAFVPPALPGMGTVAGVEYQLQDLQGDRRASELNAVANALIHNANSNEKISAAFTTFRASVPQIEVTVDRIKAKNLGITMTDIFATLQAQLGSLYVNDFNRYGQVYRVLIQAEGEFRNDPADIGQLHVRGNTGAMIPLSTLVSIHRALGPDVSYRHNQLPSVKINALTAPDSSSGEVIEVMRRLSEQTLPAGYGFDWSGQTYQELIAGNLVPLLFSMAIVFTYLALVAQYESWSIPLAVLFAVPLALLGALLSLLVVGLPINLYVQVGMVLLIGMAAKNAILIVEFARQQREQEGLGITQASVEAARLRFRAVLMTAFAFILGVLPLVLASGAGAASRVSIGLTVFSGMLMATLVGTVLIPVFFSVVQTLREKFHGNPVNEKVL